MKWLWLWSIAKRRVDLFATAFVAVVLVLSLLTHKHVLTGIKAGCEAMITANAAEDEWDGDHRTKEFEFVLMGSEHTKDENATIHFFVYNNDGRRKTYTLSMYEALRMAQTLEHAIFKAKNLDDDYGNKGPVTPGQENASSANRRFPD